jgi:membrane-associated phospholipid phosphatase
MFKALVVLLWPAVIIAILAVTALLVISRGREPVPATRQRHETTGNSVAVELRTARSSVIGMLLILVVGSVAVYGVTCLLGMLVVHAGPTIDKPIYNWMIHHRVHFWKAVMERLTKVGNTWTTWGACGAAAVCLAAFYRKDKWLPPVALGAAIVIDHFLTLALRHTFHRLGPPDSPFGTFPSGGCERIFVFYGLIAYLVWREVSGRKSTAIWSAGVVAVLGFSEAYSRLYLTLHWFTDAVSGLIYGALILAVFIATIRLVIGPGRRSGAIGPASVTVASASAAAEPSLMADETTGPHTAALP